MPLPERNFARLTVWCRPKTERHIMELTTGAILRRITETPLSTAAHKLATIILDAERPRSRWRTSPKRWGFRGSI